MTPTDSLRITIDTREQRPWHFGEFAECCRGTLDAGDYALTGDDGFPIERKSLQDFIQTISSGWERFLRELERMTAAGVTRRVIIVEGNLQKLLDHFDDEGDVVLAVNHGSRFGPSAVLGRLADLSTDGVQVLFAGDAVSAAALALMLLKRRQVELMMREVED